jgi:ABC-type nitrate/sulfonate/bicarbonate transport system ATPase subunit
MTEMTEPQGIQLNRLSLSYGMARKARLSALSNVTMRVGTGEVVAAIGPSGCGKSTLLKIVAGLLKPDGGTFSVGGRTGATDGLTSYMPQHDALLPWRTAVANAALLLEIRGASKASAQGRAMDLFARFGLSEFARARPSGLSGGMRQRVALIRTFLPACPVLLDEPFGALDAITRVELQDWLIQLQEQDPRTILLVTHDLDEALRLADRVYVMSARPGTIVGVHTVGLPKQRTVEVTTTSEFAALKADLLRDLRRGMEVAT